jgi:hypothetical protein
MIQEKPSLTPQVFWKFYSEMITEVLQNRQSYPSDGEWTKIILEKTKKLLEDTYFLKTQTEYFRLDLIGFTQCKQYDWELKVAYEHENSITWRSELCKLCYIVADLRILSSYHNFKSDEKIEVLLQKYVNNLGKQRIMRVPDSRWLFVFGPRGQCEAKLFRAFTLDSEMNVQEIQKS